MLALFTRSAITSPKMNQFEWKLEHSEYIARGWPWQILDTIWSVATAGEPGEIFCQVTSPDFTDFPSAKFHEIWKQHVDQCRDENFWSFGMEFLKCFHEVIFPKKSKNFSEICNILRL